MCRHYPTVTLPQDKHVVSPGQLLHFVRFSTSLSRLASLPKTCGLSTSPIKVFIELDSTVNSSTLYKFL